MRKIITIFMSFLINLTYAKVNKVSDERVQIKNLNTISTFLSQK
ncbi:hypothetical protein BALOs_1991 [Halobacteriovorax sp. BALOs_7]|nr:hypothetical protein BALOs_1991 [Halobacteriovorax sp. BALOs_7]